MYNCNNTGDNGALAKKVIESYQWNRTARRVLVSQRDTRNVFSIALKSYLTCVVLSVSVFQESTTVGNVLFYFICVSVALDMTFRHLGAT